MVPVKVAAVTRACFAVGQYRDKLKWRHWLRGWTLRRDALGVLLDVGLRSAVQGIEFEGRGAARFPRFLRKSCDLDG